MKSCQIVDSSAFLTDSLDYEYKTLHNTIAYSLAIFQSSSVSAVNFTLKKDKNLAKLKYKLLPKTSFFIRFYSYTEFAYHVKTLFMMASCINLMTHGRLKFNIYCYCIIEYLEVVHFIDQITEAELIKFVSLVDVLSTTMCLKNKLKC